MKTVIISMVALAISVASFANKPNEFCCPVDRQTQKVGVLTANTPVFSASTTAFATGSSESFATKMARIDDAYENQQGYLNFQQTISAALNQLETEKHLSAVENLKSLSAYNRTMTSAFLQIEANRHTEASENAHANDHFNNLMEKALTISSRI